MRSCAARGVMPSSAPIMPADTNGRASTRSINAGSFECFLRPESLRSSTSRVSRHRSWSLMPCVSRHFGLRISGSGLPSTSIVRQRTPHILTSAVNLRRCHRSRRAVTRFDSHAFSATWRHAVGPSLGSEVSARPWTRSQRCRPIFAKEMSKAAPSLTSTAYSHN